MAQRTGRQRPVSNSREDLLTAWLQRNAGRLPAEGSKEVRQRIKSHVGQAAEWFPDISKMVALGRGVLVGWKSEPISPTGDPVERFMELLNRVGPLGIEVHAETRRILGDPAFASALASMGVPQGQGKYSVGDYTRISGSGSRLLAALSDGVREHVATVPAAAQVLVGPNADPAALVAIVSSVVVDDFVKRAAADCTLVALGGVSIPAAITQGEALCQANCPLGRARLIVSVDDMSSALEDLLARWVASQHNDPMDQAMAARFAHTLIDPDYYLPSRQKIMEEFNSKAPGILRNAARRLRVSEADQLELVSHSVGLGWKRLTHTFLDAYVDPSREPDDWGYEIRKAVNLRAAEKLFTVMQQEDLEDDLATSDSHADAERYAPWDSEFSSSEPLDRVELDYWLSRDLGLTRTSEFVEFRQSLSGLRDPGRGIRELTWLAYRLVDESDRELSGPSARPPLTIQGLELARTLIETRLAEALAAGYRSVAQTKAEATAKGELGVLFDGVDFVQVALAECPTADVRPLYTAIGRVIERAVKRAAVVAFGRKALDKDV